MVITAFQWCLGVAKLLTRDISATMPDSKVVSMGTLKIINGSLIGNHMLRVQWSRNRWRHV